MTHTISTSVIVFELTGQMTHMIPVLIAVLIANAISQSIELSIYDSIIKIKRLPFLPPILTTSSLSHNVLVEDIMVRDVVFIWRNCTYGNVRKVLKSRPNLQQFPLVDNGVNMILLGSIQREELVRISEHWLSRERRLQEVRRRYSIQANILPEKISSSLNSSPKQERKSRFEVIPVQPQNEANKTSSQKPANKIPKSILKQTVSVTYSPSNSISGTQGFHLIILSLLN